MVAGWLINLAVAEWYLRHPARVVTAVAVRRKTERQKAEDLPALSRRDGVAAVPLARQPTRCHLFCFSWHGTQKRACGRISSRSGRDALAAPVAGTVGAVADPVQRTGDLLDVLAGGQQQRGLVVGLAGVAGVRVELGQFPQPSRLGGEVVRQGRSQVSQPTLVERVGR